MFAHKGMALPLDPYIKRDQRALKEYVDDVSPQLVKSMAYNGKQYQLPFTWNGTVIHYNSEMFARAGIARPRDDWTVDDFLAIARRLTSGSGSGSGDGQADTWGFVAPNAYFGGVIPWVFNAGTDLLSDDWATSRVNDPRTVEAFQLYQDFSAKHRIAPPEFAEVEKLVLGYLGKLTANEVTAKTAMEQLDRELSGLLARRAPPAS